MMNVKTNKEKGKIIKLSEQQFTFVLRHYKYTSTTNTLQLYRPFSIHNFPQEQKPIR